MNQLANFGWKSHERQYTLTDSTFIKSELPEEALPISHATGRKVYPPWSRERLQNEAATLKFIASMTTIPVPKFLALYEVNGLLQLKTERVTGISLEDMASENATKHVANYLESSVLPSFANGTILPSPRRSVLRLQHQYSKSRKSDCSLDH
ncbi:hypothetical protein P154DRAFT_625791 [Amniculicola lignicola CBS 123094]|uniref:Aminoglycoside phosphotransferase domain-containing protein n=1 Tax=Amniculicola lignicola CBS 123094 TaxID=1392246 RepID=A0A6A5VTT1_9PLEO|nr:hypothetical protein P154DRAFT_625791 [Amniculicola lignicola CBS 123094]